MEKVQHVEVTGGTFSSSGEMKELNEIKPESVDDDDILSEMMKVSDVIEIYHEKKDDTNIENPVVDVVALMKGIEESFIEDENFVSDQVISFSTSDDLDIPPDSNMTYELGELVLEDHGLNILHKLVLCYDFHPLEVLERIPRYKHLVNNKTVSCNFSPLFLALVHHIKSRRLPLIKALVSISEINNKLLYNIATKMIPDVELYMYLFEIGMNPNHSFEKFYAHLVHCYDNSLPEEKEAYDRIYELYISHGVKHENYHTDKLKGKIRSLTAELVQLRKEHQTLIDHVKLMPGGIEYFELEKSFKDKRDEDVDKFDEDVDKRDDDVYKFDEDVDKRDDDVDKRDEDVDKFDDDVDKRDEDVYKSDEDIQCVIF